MKKVSWKTANLPTKLSAAFIVLVIAALGVHLLLATHAATPTWNFTSSGLEGSGFQNVVAYSPFKDSNGNRPVLLGADIAGIHSSIDDGKNWMPEDVGLPNNHVAALMWSDTTPGKVYAATDSKLAVSTDFGITWHALAAPVNFDANGSYQLNGQEHPRPTGQLLVQDNSGSTKYIYAATATQGVKRSSDGGATWEKVALAGDHLRSLALDPSNPDRLYVATVEAGLQVTTTARGAFTFSRAAGSPNIPEEMRFIAGKLYIATHDNGIQMYDGAWHALNNGIALTSAWESITGYRDSGGNIVLYVGCTNPVSGQDIMKSTDGGATWTTISTGSNVTISPLEYGQNYDWWAATNNYLSVHGGAFVVADIAVDPDNPNLLLLAGRGGAKAVIQSGSNYTWYPSVHGLMVTVNNSAVADPHVPGRVYIASMDYTFLSSNDHGKTIIPGTAPSNPPSTGDYIALDLDGPSNQPSPVYLAASKRGQNTGFGILYSNPDPVGTPNNWTDEHIPVSNDILSVGVGHDSSGARVILASITGHGLYRKVGSSWSQITGTTPFAGGGYGTIVWNPHSQLVYAMDGSGVWYSPSAGAQGTWHKIAGGSAGYDNIDSLVIDPTNSSIVYASDTSLGGVVRIANANSASPTVTKIANLSRPGPIAINASDQLFIHDRNGAKLWYSPSPKSASAAGASNAAPDFVNVADSFYADNNDNIRSLAVSSDGYVYTASNSAGMTVGSASSVPPTQPPDNPPSVSLAPLNTSAFIGATVTVSASASDDHGINNVSFAYKLSSAPTWTTIGSPDVSTPYSVNWNTTGLSNGSYDVRATATDTAGQTATSLGTITLMSEALAPTVNYGSPSPADNSTISGTTTITASAANANTVQLLVDGSVAQTSSNLSATFQWDTSASPNGPHTVQLKALNASGGSGLSPLLHVTVSNVQSPGSGDTNNDGHVNTADLSVLITNFGTNYPAADFNHDGTVNGADMHILLTHWTW